ncbi:Na+/H+ antiporter subunit E [Acuticoccus mangrovi]|uniref:Na+/H+ antiporter subunit E n=1 Tax=Acuticoccus mangrovi TaxID=2796142 RepID=A0A934ILJ3_9HYPH|nr:Na+/H+ antiporter subunit E [Acuticoccus mangrovi]MBJ3774487.1 Na+/H+ antiporter subunit E [Acuticoccus mangrovi]
MGLIFINVMLAIAWAFLTGSVSFVNLAFGFVLGGIALALIREQAGSVSHFRRTFSIVKLAVIFVYELVKSSIIVARLVLSPHRTLSPAIIAYPLEVRTDAEITLLANLITLTPGTLSMDVSDDRSTLYVHAIDAPEPDAVIADIKKSFEDRIRKVFHP